MEKMAPTKVSAHPIAIFDLIPYVSLKILPGMIIIAENIVKLTTRN